MKFKIPICLRARSEKFASQADMWKGIQALFLLQFECVWENNSRQRWTKNCSDRFWLSSMERDISTVIQHILPSPESMLLCSQCIMRDLHKPIDNVEGGGGGGGNEKQFW